MNVLSAVPVPDIIAAVCSGVNLFVFLISFDFDATAAAKSGPSLSTILAKRLDLLSMVSPAKCFKILFTASACFLSPCPVILFPKGSWF